MRGTAAQIASDLDPAAWQRLSAGQGTKGPRLHDWACFELADLDADEYAEGSYGTWTRDLLIRRPVADGDPGFFTTWCPAGTTIKTLVGGEGHRWAIEDSFETAKNELGLDHDETRSRHGWHCHVSPVMLALAMRRPSSPCRCHPPEKNPDESMDLIRWSVQEIRRVVVRLAQRRLEPRHVIAWSAGAEPIGPSHNAHTIDQKRNCNVRLSRSARRFLATRPDRRSSDTERIRTIVIGCVT